MDIRKNTLINVVFSPPYVGRNDISPKEGKMPFPVEMRGFHPVNFQ